MTATNRCLICSQTMNGRPHQKTCSDRCRKALQRRESKDATNVISLTAVHSRPKLEEPPEAPDRLGSYGRGLWDALWTLHPALAATDVYVVQRYCELQDRCERIKDELGNSFMSVGAQGQDILHPLAKFLADTERECRNLEDRLGLNPRHTFTVDAPELKSAIDRLREAL